MVMVKFTLAVIGLAILGFFFLGTQDIWAAGRGNLTSARSGDKMNIVSYGVSGEQRASGSDFAYTIDINAALRLKPQKEATTIVPVVIYKGVEKRAQVRESTGSYADTFTVAAGEEASGQIIRAQILTPLPLLQRIDGRGSGQTFVQGFPYVFEDVPGSGSNFKLIANQVSAFTLRDGSGNPEQVCAAHFIAECASTLRPSEILTKCADPANPDERCRDVLELCGAKITLIVRDVNCGQSTVTVDYETQCTACTKWDVGETAVINFFRVDTDNPQSSCVYSKTGLFEQGCFSDRLGGTALMFDPSAIMPR